MTLYKKTLTRYVHKTTAADLLPCNVLGVNFDISLHHLKQGWNTGRLYHGLLFVWVVVHWYVKIMRGWFLPKLTFEFSAVSHITKCCCVVLVFAYYCCELCCWILSSMFLMLFCCLCIWLFTLGIPLFISLTLFSHLAWVFWHPYCVMLVMDCYSSFQFYYSCFEVCSSKSGNSATRSTVAVWQK